MLEKYFTTIIHQKKHWFGWMRKRSFDSQITLLLYIHFLQGIRNPKTRFTNNILATDMGTIHFNNGGIWGIWGLREWFSPVFWGRRASPIKRSPGFWLQFAQTWTLWSYPRKGTGRRSGEHSSHTSCSQAWQWCLDSLAVKSRWQMWQERICGQAPSRQDAQHPSPGLKRE